MPDPDEPEFHRLFELYAQRIGCAYNREAVEHLLARHYRPVGRPLRRCHPRDLLMQMHNYCSYNAVPMEMKPDLLDLVVDNYFTVVGER